MGNTVRRMTELKKGFEPLSHKASRQTSKAAQPRDLYSRRELTMSLIGQKAKLEP